LWLVLACVFGSFFKEIMVAILAFTGAAVGLTENQKNSLRNVLAERQFDSYTSCHNNGDGADQEFERLVYFRGLKKTETDSTLNPMRRNRQLVENSTILFAAPPNEGFVSAKGSGTWQTIKYAWKAGVPVYIFWPSGKVNRSVIKGDFPVVK
jgi:uncharacterized membrane protein